LLQPVGDIGQVHGRIPGGRNVDGGAGDLARADAVLFEQAGSGLLDLLRPLQQRPEHAEEEALVVILTRTFLGVAVTIQPDHVSTASVQNRLATLSCKAVRPW
jgi:hypothetical protein